VVAVAASILVAAYYMLKTGAIYQDLGVHHCERLDRNKASDRLVRRLAALATAYAWNRLRERPVSF
jgi:hypothetical protein